MSVPSQVCVYILLFICVIINKLTTHSAVVVAVMDSHSCNLGSNHGHCKSYTSMMLYSQ